MAFYPYDSQFNGIIRHLQRAEEKENVKYISTSSSSRLIDNYNWGGSDQILDVEIGYEHDFASANEPYPNVSIYFLRNRVNIQSYTIQSRFEEIDKLCAWNIYGSNNNNSWYFIDERGPINDLLNDGSYKNYNVMKSGIYRYFRITSTSKSISKYNNERSNWYMIISRFEIFGELYPLNPYYQIKQIIFPQLMHFIFLLHS